MPALKRTFVLPFLAVLALTASTLAAHADTIQDFTVNMTVLGGGTITGTVDVDLSSGASTTGDLTYTNGGTTVAFDGRVLDYGQTFSPATISFVFYDNTVANELDIELPVSSVSGLSGYSGSVCTIFNSLCGSYISYVKIDNASSDIWTSTFVPAVATTPEPSSLLLLGTGLLGVFAALRRKPFPVC